MDDELLAILRGKLVPPGGGNFARTISRYEDLWEEISPKLPTPFQPRRSTFWDYPLTSQRPSLMQSYSPSLPARYSEVDRVAPCQSPVGAERASTKPSQVAPWLANIMTAKSTSTQRWTRRNPMAKEYNISSPPESPQETNKARPGPAHTKWNLIAMGYHPSSPPESQQGTDNAHPGPAHTRLDPMARESYPSSPPESQQGTDKVQPGPTYTRWNPMAMEYHLSPSPESRQRTNNAHPGPTHTSWNPMAMGYHRSPSPESQQGTDKANPCPTHTRWNPMAMEFRPSPSPESPQGTDGPHSGPTDARQDMRLAAVPSAMESPVSCPSQASSSWSVPTKPSPLNYANSSLQRAASYPRAQLGPAQSYSLPANSNLPQHKVASALNGMASAAHALLKWRRKNPNAGPPRQVLSQSKLSMQAQTLHQAFLELKKRNSKEEAAMRARRAGPSF